jgi:hypothetical protein
MTQDVIEGARYYDSAFDDHYTITNIGADTDDADPSEIMLTLEYEGHLGTVSITLEQFRSESGHECIGLPDDM